MSDSKQLNITTNQSDDFPIRATYIYDNIPPDNAEDIIWQHLVDTKNEIEQNEIGVGLTQTYQYTKLNDESTIITKWQGIKTANGNEFRIGLGIGKPGSKQTPPIMQGNFKDGVTINTDLNFSNTDFSIGERKGRLCIKFHKKWYIIQLGDEVA